MDNIFDGQNLVNESKFRHFCQTYFCLIDSLFCNHIIRTRHLKVRTQISFVRWCADKFLAWICSKIVFNFQGNFSPVVFEYLVLMYKKVLFNSTPPSVHRYVLNTSEIGSFYTCQTFTKMIRVKHVQNWSDVYRSFFTNFSPLKDVQNWC